MTGRFEWFLAADPHAASCGRLSLVVRLGGRFLRAPQLLAQFLRLTDDHAFRALVERFPATSEDDDIHGLTSPGGGEAVARAYVLAVGSVRLDELSEHLLNEPGLGRRSHRRAEYVEQRSSPLNSSPLPETV